MIPPSTLDQGLPSGRIYATWRGPNGANGVEFANPSATNTFARFSAPGVYRLLLTARDGASEVGGLASTQAVTITVKAITEPLVINDVDEVSVGVGGLRGFWNHYTEST